MKGLDCFFSEIRRLKAKVFERRKGAACPVQVTVPCSAEVVGALVLKVVKMFAGSMDKGRSIC